MKIVKTEEFIKMPAGTIFAPYKPCIYLEEFQIKVDSGDGTSYVGTMPLRPWFVDDEWHGEGQHEVEFAIYDGSSADVIGYDLIAVLEEKDIINYINVLKWALNGCKGDV